jgi:hypothetical protein
VIQMKKGQEMSKDMPTDTGNVRGDAGDLPDRGTSRGTTGKDMHLDGASIDADATNRLGGFKGSSDAPEQDMPHPCRKGRY